mmetsp:Transcript_9121/g.27364  ORF Transcript_9121/g.27364 Transcript_9121/m.27364 type:complete len:339 (-) Transcript_9121:4814-5830(-)
MSCDSSLIESSASDAGAMLNFSQQAASLFIIDLFMDVATSKSALTPFSTAVFSSTISSTSRNRFSAALSDCSRCSDHSLSTRTFSSRTAEILESASADCFCNSFAATSRHVCKLALSLSFFSSARLTRFNRSSTLAFSFERADHSTDCFSSASSASAKDLFRLESSISFLCRDSRVDARSESRQPFSLIAAEHFPSHSIVCVSNACFKLDSSASFSCTALLLAASSASNRSFSFKAADILPSHSAACFSSILSASSISCSASSMDCLRLHSSASFSRIALLDLVSSASINTFSVEAAEILSSHSAVCLFSACSTSSNDCVKLHSCASFAFTSSSIIPS